MSRESQSSTDKNFTDGPLTPLEKKVFAFFFQNLFEKGSRLQAQSSFLSIFQYKPLSISVENYIDNLEKSDVTFSHMVLAVIYILRLHTTSCNIKRPIYIHPLTIAYLLPTALTLAQKYLDDMATYNIDMAHAACIPLPIMNKLEREMLFTMQGNLYVSPSYYQTIIRGVFSEYNSQASSFKIFPKSSLPPDRRLTDSDIATFSHYFEILYPSGNCLQSRSNFLSIFHCATKPSYTIRDYIEHLNYYCHLTLYKMLLATNYIYHLHSNTFNTKNPIYIHEFTVHRLLLAALVLVLRQHYQNISPEILKRALTRISCVTEGEIQELSNEMEIYCNYARTTLSDYESIHEQVFSETIQHTIFKMPDSNPSCTDSIAPNENEADYNSEPGLVKLDFP